MRIVGGIHRGRPLKAPPGRDLRPTSDRAREALFNILGHGMAGVDLDGASVLDVFAGTGAFGLEALSRGADHATFIDNSAEAIKCLRQNADALGESLRATPIRADATRLPPPPLVAQAPCAFAFLDPPYGSGLAVPALNALVAQRWIAAGTLSVVEIAAKEPFQAPDPFDCLDERTYGAARLVFLSLSD